MQTVPTFRFTSPTQQSNNATEISTFQSTSLTVTTALFDTSLSTGRVTAKHFPTVFSFVVSFLENKHWLTLVAAYCLVRCGKGHVADITNTWWLYSTMHNAQCTQISRSALAVAYSVWFYIQPCVVSIRTVIFRTQHITHDSLLFSSTSRKVYKQDLLNMWSSVEPNTESFFYPSYSSSRVNLVSSSDR